MIDVDDVRWHREFLVDGKTVRAWSYHNINDGTNFDLWIEYEGVRYISTIYDRNDIRRWYDENIDEAYFCDPSFILLRKIEEKEIELAVLDIVRSDKIESYFDAEDSEAK